MYYIAYGSNLNSQWMSKLCPGAVKVGTGILEDYQLKFCGEKDAVYATVVEHLQCVMPVAVWDIDRIHEEALDQYEDFPSLYIKDMLTIKLNGETIEGMVYLMINQKEGIPKEEYVEMIKQGYDENGFDWNIVELALKRS